MGKGAGGRGEEKEGARRRFDECEAEELRGNESR